MTKSLVVPVPNTNKYFLRADVLGHPRRLLIVDPNIEGLRGHFLELALEIAQAADQQGFQPTLLAARSIEAEASLSASYAIRPTFSCRKIRRWSLGPHGYSRVCRDFGGHPVGGSVASRLWQRCIDRFHGAPPSDVVRQTADELVDAFDWFQPTERDQILFSTCDDFVLLVVAAAVKRWRTDCPLNLAFLWHSPVQAGRECERRPMGFRQRQMACQLATCMDAMQLHRLQFFATTQELSRQLNQVLKPDLWRPINYPIRSAFRPLSSQQPAILPTQQAAVAGSEMPVRAVCGGALRSEKGQRQLKQVTELLWADFLNPGRLQLGLQLGQADAERMIPRKFNVQRDAPEAAHPFEIAGSSLSPEAYLDWIQSADIGLFLYNSRKYYARCSGVLLEMLACGKPVIVPAGSWLSRQICGPNAAHLQRLSRELAGNTEQLPVSERPLSTTQHSAHEATLAGHTQSVLCTAQLSGIDNQSYLAIEAVQRGGQGPISSQLHVLEVQDGVCRVLIEAPKAEGSSTPTTTLRFWSPYGERHMRIESLECKRLGGANISPVSCGIGFARNSDLPACFDTLLRHYKDIKHATIAQSESLRQKHSGLAFYEACLSACR